MHAHNTHTHCLKLGLTGGHNSRVFLRIRKYALMHCVVACTPHSVRRKLDSSLLQVQALRNQKKEYIEEINDKQRMIDLLKEDLTSHKDQIKLRERNLTTKQHNLVRKCYIHREKTPQHPRFPAPFI